MENVHKEVKSFLVNLMEEGEREATSREIDEVFRKFMQQRIHVGYIIKDVCLVLIATFYLLSRLIIKPLEYINKKLAVNLNRITIPVACILSAVIIGGCLRRLYVPFLGHAVALCQIICYISSAGIGIATVSKYLKLVASNATFCFGYVWEESERVAKKEENKRILPVAVALTIAISIYYTIPLVLPVMEKTTLTVVQLTILLVSYSIKIATKMYWFAKILLWALSYLILVLPLYMFVSMEHYRTGIMKTFWELPIVVSVDEEIGKPMREKSENLVSL